MARPDGVLTARGQSFLAVGVVLLAVGLALGLGDLVRLGLLLPALALGSWLVARRPVRWVTADREVRPARLVAGDHGAVRLAVTNTGRWRSPVLVAQEEVGYALGDRPRFVLPPLRPGASAVVDYPVRALVRGEHALGPLAVRVRDPFGLTSRLTRVPGTSSVLVLPAVLPLGDRAGRGSGQGRDEEDADTVALHGEDDVTIRAYRDGDELRRIHWPASAHTGQLMVRQEEQPSRRRGVVLLDPRPGAHAGEGARSTFEWAVVTAASVTAHLLQHGYEVVLLTAPGDDQQRPVGLDEALDRLARAGTTGDDGLAGLARAAGLAPAATVVAVLGGLDAPGVEDLARARRPGATAVALVVRPARSPARPAEPAPPHDPVMDLLRAHGWRAAATRTDQPPAVPWREATSGPGGPR